MVTLYLRNSSPPAQMPEEIKANYNTVEEALAQAVHDVRDTGRVEGFGYLPQRIEDESGKTLYGRDEIEAAAAAEE